MVRKAIEQTRKGLGRVHADFQSFLALEVAGSAVLLVATIVALIFANSSIAEAYHAFWEIDIGFFIGSFEFEETLLHWIDDGLMAIFFFVVGLEIKREFIAGELSALRKATLPIFAAAGGMVVPALIYLAINAGGEGARGWGVPMATDIAFALGVLALLGSRIPIGLKVFLTALAIVDDIGAILVIALFYTDEIAYGWLGVGVALLLLLVAFNILDVDSPVPYVVVASVVWFAFLHSGVHATICGVLVAFTIPARSRMEPMQFVNYTRSQLDRIEACEVPGAHVLEDSTQQHCAFEISTAAAHAAAPLQRLEHALLPFTTFVVLPLFALANAGVTLRGYDIGELMLAPISLGIFFGLLVGKVFGVTLMSWLAVKLKIADLPAGVTWKHVVGAGMLAGIGFTMSLFISGLAFRGDILRAEARLSILVTSVVAGIVGYVFLRMTTTEAPSEDAG